MGESTIEICWAEGVRAEVTGDALLLTGPDSACRIGRPPARLLAAVEALTSGGATWSVLMQRARIDGDALGPAKLHRDLERLAASGWLCAIQRAREGHVLAELAPGAGGIKLPVIVDSAAPV